MSILLLGPVEDRAYNEGLICGMWMGGYDAVWDIIISCIACVYLFMWEENHIKRGLYAAFAVVSKIPESHCVAHLCSQDCCVELYL